jgi:ribosomal protein S18 acetylase RimI-like enzyme
VTDRIYDVRRATPDDALAISELYDRVYTPTKGGNARNYYPFPQLMTSKGVKAMICGSEIVWLVAAAGATIVGSAAAKRNIGDVHDRIAEVFGVAVDAAHRHGGLGSALVCGLVKALGDSWEFILCEARTDNPGGWKVARRAGFRPVGYEPYAHTTPVGFESMVLTGCWPQWSSAHGSNGAAPPMEQASRLREAVIGLPSTADVPGTSRDVAQGQAAALANIDVNIRRDDNAGRRWFDGPAATFDRRAGVIGLNPLQGEDDRSPRFTQRLYVAFSGFSEVGAARVIYDPVDTRARVLGVRTAAPGVRAALLHHLVDDLLQTAADRLVIIVLVDSNCSEAQVDLTNLGFFPTVYLPAFVAAPDGRSDGVQYTRLYGCSLGESVNSVTAKHWPEAERVIAEVLRFSP